MEEDLCPRCMKFTLERVDIIEDGKDVGDFWYCIDCDYEREDYF